MRGSSPQRKAMSAEPSAERPLPGLVTSFLDPCPRLLGQRFERGHLFRRESQRFRSGVSYLLVSLQVVLPALLPIRADFITSLFHALRPRGTPFFQRSPLIFSQHGLRFHLQLGAECLC